MAKIHADVLRCGVMTSDAALNKHIGKRCRFIHPTCPFEKDAFTVVGVQRIYDGSLALRVVGDTEVHQFGRPARLSEIEFVPTLRRVK